MNKIKFNSLNLIKPFLIITILSAVISIIVFPCQVFSSKIETAMLKVTSVHYGKPCDKYAYEQFFTKAITEQNQDTISALAKSKFAKVDEADVYFRNILEDLCIEITENKVVDTKKYDCYPNPGSTTLGGSCSCGRELGKVDFRLPQPPVKNHDLKQYNSVIGLDQFLVLQDNDHCVSGYQGHCTLSENIAVREELGVGVMTCRVGYECVEAKIQRLTNKETMETYGICEAVRPDVSQYDTDLGISLHNLQDFPMILILGYLIGTIRKL